MTPHVVNESFRVHWVSIDTAVITIVGGAVGWINTDISGSIANGSRNVQIHSFPTAGQCGVRENGSTKAPTAGSAHLRSISMNGQTTVDLYRAATDNYYYVLAYDK